MKIFSSQKILFLVLLFLSNFILAQNRAEDAIKIFQEKYPQEKIHITLNKNSYLAGETLWFKAFVFEGYNISKKSTSIFIELYDKNKNSISNKIFPLLNGEGSGSILLPENLNEDVYYIRAYTTWMTNFSENFNLIKPIKIFNPKSDLAIIKDTISQWSATIHAESGTFISNINTTLAVRTKSNGIPPKEWKGVIIEKDKPEKILTNFNSFDQNVAVFHLTPVFGKKYQAILTDKLGNKNVIDLPEVENSGLNLQVKNDSDFITFSLKSNNLENNSAYYKILGTIDNQLVYKAKINKIDNSKVYSIPTDKLINGILNLTVFDENENILLERLCFVQSQKLNIIKPKINSSDINTNPRAENSFNIENNSNTSDYMVMVVDNNTSTSEDENSFLSSLWLTGDITSDIIQPSQYFNENNNFEALDALLISENWKRFNWKNLISGIYPIIKNEPKMYISYKGKILINHLPAKNKELNLLLNIPNYGNKIYQVKTDNNGIFYLENLIFEDKATFSYQLNEEIESKDVQIYFQSNLNFSTLQNNLPKSKYKLVDRNNSTQNPIEIEKAIQTKKSQELISKKLVTIEEIKLKGKAKDITRELNFKLSSPLFRSVNEQVIDLVNDNESAQNSQNIIQWLTGRVAGLQVQLSNGDYIPIYRQLPVTIYLDEMRSSISTISTIPLSTIAMVKILKENFALGGTSIAIYTKQGNSISSETESKSSFRKITLNGYNKEDQFIIPDYKNNDLSDINSDYRDILYWNPYLESIPKKSSKITFYNSDITKNFRIIILGFDRNNSIPIYFNESLK